MPRYEYAIVTLCSTDDDGVTNSELAAKMTRLGKQGYRLAHVRQGITTVGSFHYPLAIMERESDDEPLEEEDTSAREDAAPAPTTTKSAYEWDDDDE